ncbi:MAG: TraR/DksA C4-type zinc finger protein [Bacillota bacterium]
MQEDDYRRYKKALLKEKQKLIKHTENLDGNSRGGLLDSLKDSTGELSSYDNHPSDQGPNMFEREKDLGLKDNARRLLVQIDDALDKLEEGKYGICDICQQEINRERLELIPYTTRCVACNNKLDETEDANSLQPVAEENLYPPYGRTFTDDSENVSFDGEDSWQAVARYGTVNTPSDFMEADQQSEAYIDSDENRGTPDWTDRISEEGFVTASEEFGAEEIISHQPTASENLVEEELDKDTVDREE